VPRLCMYVSFCGLYEAANELSGVVRVEVYVCLDYVCMCLSGLYSAAHGLPGVVRVEVICASTRRRVCVLVVPLGYMQPPTSYPAW